MFAPAPFTTMRMLGGPARRERGRALGAGASWVIGGSVWTTHVVLLFLRPVGCIADQCGSSGPHRPTEDLLWLFAIAVASVAVGMLIVPVRPGARGSLFRWAALILTFAGAAAVALGVAMNAVAEGGSPLWWLHDSDSLGRALPVLGSIAAGVAALRGHWLRPWLGIVLIVASLLCLGFNAQTDRILWAVPLGVAWLLAGVITLSASAPRHRGRSAEDKPDTWSHGSGNPGLGSDAGRG